MNRFIETNDHDKLLTRDEAAAYLGTAKNTLAVWACKKRYPLPMIKIGKAVRYRLSDLKKFVESYETNKID